MKVIVAGSRYFEDYDFVKRWLDHIFSNSKPALIISGGAKGVDALGERYARENEIPLHIEFAQWKQYGNSAGPKRNYVMASLATHCVVFWSGKSRGSGDMVKKAQDAELTLKQIAIKI